MAVALGVLATNLTAIAARAFTPAEMTSIDKCTGRVNNEFALIKTYPRFVIQQLFFGAQEGDVDLYCGHNVSGEVRHGIVHITANHRINSSGRLGWENERQILLTKLPENPPATWEEMLDIALVKMLSDKNQPVLNENGASCYEEKFVVGKPNQPSSVTYERLYVVWTRNVGSFGFPSNAVSTAYPATRDCKDRPVASITRADADGVDTEAGTSASTDNSTYLSCNSEGCIADGPTGYAVQNDGQGVFYVGGPFKAKWAEKRSVAGYPNRTISCGWSKNGCFQNYDRGGSIYYTPDTGAHHIGGSIRTKWGSLGYERSTLGYPTTDESCGWTRGGCFNHFQNNSSIYYSTATGSHTVMGAIKNRWATLNYERGFLGYPSTDQTCGLVRSGCYNHFENNSSIYYSPKTGAWPMSGAFRTRWSELNWERGELGYPISGEYRPSGAPSNHRQQDFEGGFLYWDGARVSGG